MAYEIRNDQGEAVATRDELLYARDDAQRRADTYGRTYTVTSHGVTLATCTPGR